MTKELAKGYEPHDVEKRWYTEWETKGYFHAAAQSDKKPYSIVIPPPNVTGALHMGACPQQYPAGHPLPLETDAGV